jgi:UPF0755 protein
MKGPVKGHSTRPLLLAVVFAIVGAIAAACGGDRGATVRVTIRKGSPFREAAESLSAHGVVKSARLFGVYAKLRGHDRTLRYGTYVIRSGLSWEQLLDALRAGKGIVHTVTVPEGYTMAQIAPLLADALELSDDSIAAAVRDTALLHRLDVPTPTLEGYLFPDTYSFADHTTAREAVRTMVERFEKAWKPEWDDRLKEVAMSRNDIVTLASIVEKEVRRREEGPVVAAVYLNRLKAHIPLMADPTVTYALGKKPGRVYFKDLRVDSPYNTYRVRGLPPGPIASPGSASLQAALYPAKVPFLYFVAHPDGHHEFRKTYKEHLESIKMVRAVARADSAARDKRQRDATDSTGKAAAAKDSARP